MPAELRWPLAPLGRILGGVLAVLLGGALLAPPLYAAGQWAVHSGLLPQLRPFGFDKYLNRALMVVAALAVLRSLGARRAWLGGAPTAPRLLTLLVGMVVAAGSLGLLVFGLCACRLMACAQLPPPSAWALALALGGSVGLIEEAFFRGALFAALRQTMRWPAALAVLSVLFAALHFVRPLPGAAEGAPVGPLSGLALLPQLFWQFAQPRAMAGVFVTLVLMGVVLGYSVVRTQSLYLAVGLHAGWVAALKLVMQSCVPLRPSYWVGADVRGGLGPALLMLLTLAALHLTLRPRAVAP